MRRFIYKSYVAVASEMKKCSLKNSLAGNYKASYVTLSYFYAYINEQSLHRRF